MSTTADHKPRRMTMMPVMTMEEVPIVSDAERAEMLASLKEAEAQIAAGEYVAHDPSTFVERLMEIRANALRKKTV